MEQPKIIAKSENFKAIDIGSFNQLSKYDFIHPKFKTVDHGRLFIGELLQTTGSEISFRELPPNTNIPFLHKHKNHEEIYIFLKGQGKFQVDDEVFNIREGSVVKVSPEGNRTLGNTSKEVMIYMVVQSKTLSLDKYNVLDGYRSEGKIKIN